jgi:hypothetical protein
MPPEMSNPGAVARAGVLEANADSEGFPHHTANPTLAQPSVELRRAADRARLAANRATLRKHTAETGAADPEVPAAGDAALLSILCAGVAA